MGGNRREQQEPQTASEHVTERALEKIYLRLRAQTGHDFFYYKRQILQLRVERRMTLLQLENLEQYASYLPQNPYEVELLFKELLIGVTAFFRDPSAWLVLQRKVLKDQIERHTPGEPLRAWVAGCSTGEEAYSLAIAFREVADSVEGGQNFQLRIFATDLDPDAIDQARAGVYPENIAAAVSSERLRRFFVREKRGYRVTPEIRDSVVFTRHNMIMHSPISRLDLLCCRNFLIYLSAGLQEKLLSVFRYCLKPEGVLFLGSSESATTKAKLFQTVDSQSRIYRTREQSDAMRSVGIHHALELTGAAKQSYAHVQAPAAPLNHAQGLAALADRTIAQHFAPLCIFCDSRGDILHVNNETRGYLEPAVGKTNVNILALAHDGLRQALSSAFAAARAEPGSVVTQPVQMDRDGGRQSLQLTVQRLKEPAELSGIIMVVIAKDSDALAQPRPEPKSNGVAMHRELTRTREELQTTREEMQTFRELLKHTHQDLQSANSRLQSANAQLTKSESELRSLNAELHAVNSQLQSKLDELSHTNSQLTHLTSKSEHHKPS